MGWCHPLQRAARWTHPSSGVLTHTLPIGSIVTALSQRITCVHVVISNGLCSTYNAPLKPESLSLQSLWQPIALLQSEQGNELSNPRTYYTHVERQFRLDFPQVLVATNLERSASRFPGRPHRSNDRIIILLS